MKRLAMLWRVLTALADVILNPRSYRRRSASVLVLALPLLSGCATTTKPLTIACTSCALLQSSGLCTSQAAADRALAAPKMACPEGQRQEIVNYRQWLDGIEAPKVECRNYR
jgi:hypothetical protein